MDLPASLGLGFPSSQNVVIQLRGKTGALPCIQTHSPPLGYELCEAGRLGKRVSFGPPPLMGWGGIPSSLQ